MLRQSEFIKNRKRLTSEGKFTFPFLIPFSTSSASSTLSNLSGKWPFVCSQHVPSTGGIERFSAKENFRKILKVSHFDLGSSPNKNNNKIKYSQWVSLNFLYPDCENSNETQYEPEKSDEAL